MESSGRGAFVLQEITPTWAGILRTEEFARQWWGTKRLNDLSQAT